MRLLEAKLIILVVLVPMFVWAQAPAPEAAPPPAPAPVAAPATPAPAPGSTSSAPVAGPNGPPASPAPAAAATPAKEEGDVITLKSGAVMKGVQVIRRTPVELLVQVTDDVTLSIPQKQVANVKLDSIDPVNVTRQKTDSTPQEGSLIPGDKLSPQLHEKMVAPIPAPPLKFENQDFVVILDDLSKRIGVPIEIDEKVKSLPEDQRKWTYEAKADTTPMAFLQEGLLKQFKNLSMELRFDRIVVTMK